MVNIPHKDLTLDQAARLWAQDRESLGECKARQKALADAVGAL